MSVTVNVCISALEAEIASSDYLDMDNERIVFLGIERVFLGIETR